MNFLFVHQNFPGQFRHLARALANDPNHQVVGIGEIRNLQAQPSLHPRIRMYGYESPGPGGKETHHYLRDFEGHVRRAQSVIRLLIDLRDKEGFRPDVVVSHPGWGEGLFLKDIFPHGRIIQYFEYYYQPFGGDVGFDREFPATLDDHLRIRIKNSTQLHSLIGCDEGVSPTDWQRSRYPAELRNRIEVIHEGIDTAVVRPSEQAWVEIGGQRFVAGDEIVTYVARNLEPYRGFHTFIRMLPALQARRPGARIIIVGGDGVSYGRPPPEGKTWRQVYCSEVGSRVDWSKVHFVGKLPYERYLNVLQVSAAHVYLTYPFVLSWSMLEAMAAGCVLIASATAPVLEVVEHGDNGWLVDFFDSEQLAERVSDALAAPAKSAALRQRARSTVVERYDLQTRCLPKMLAKVLRDH